MTNFILKEWHEFVKFSNKIYGERLEVFTCTPCLIDPCSPGHDSLTCSECSVINQDAKGIVDLNIPI